MGLRDWQSNQFFLFFVDAGTKLDRFLEEYSSTSRTNRFLFLTVVPFLMLFVTVGNWHNSIFLQADTFFLGER